jgi:acyl-CoA thioesterase FadM
VWFTDPVEIRLAVIRLGRSSATLSFEIDGPAGRVADGEVTIVHTASSAGDLAPWPQAARAALGGVRPSTRESGAT